MINNNEIRSQGSAGFGAYLDRTRYARASGVDLFDVKLEHRTVELLQDGLIKCRRWDGSMLTEETIPINQVKVFYNYMIGSLGNHLGYSEVLQEAKRSGAAFINSGIAGDKLHVHSIFRSSETPTPETHKFTEKSFLELLEKFDYLFIKPRLGAGGTGQITIRRHSDGFSIKTSEGKEFKTVSIEEVYSICISESASQSIIQEGKTIERIDGSVYDIRAIFQKDGNGKTTFTAAYSRIGVSGSDQANISMGGSAKDPRDFIKGYDLIIQQIIPIGKRLIGHLDANVGNVGEIGIDFIFPDASSPIVLEFNEKLGYGGLIQLAREKGGKWTRALENFLRKPMDYAKFLSHLE